MWAHYAQNLEGFVIEFDEGKLVESFPESGFGNVDYRDASDAGLSDMLYRASEIGKPRYVYMLRKGVFRAAYYTKATCWSYEQERRMIVRESETRRLEDIILMDLPKECVTAFVSGPRASVDTISALRAKAAELGCRYFQLKIGRTSAAPFFVDSGSNLNSRQNYNKDRAKNIIDQGYKGNYRLTLPPPIHWYNYTNEWGVLICHLSM